MKKLQPILISCFLFLAVLGGVCAGATITVGPDVGNFDYTSIQAAIDNAANGDEIVVAPGTYIEAINFNGKAVRLVSSDGPEDTIINGTGHYHVVQCVSGEDPNTILEGFTITGGNANGDLEDGFGGGMFNLYSSPKVVNCIFSENMARNGAGMYNHESSPMVIDCVFYRNRTIDGQNGASPGQRGRNSGVGGGMLNSFSLATITNCSFIENSTGRGGHGAQGSDYNGTGGDGGNAGNGAGIYNTLSDVTISLCQFKDNKTGAGGNGGHGGWSNFWKSQHTGVAGAGGTGGWGAGMYSEGSNVVVTSSVFYGNKAGSGGVGGRSSTRDKCGHGGTGGSGGGMFSDGHSVVVSNCTFVANEAGSGGNGGIEDRQVNRQSTCGGDGGHGGGMYNTSLSIEVTNCTFNQNKTGNTGNFGQVERKEVYGLAGNGAGIYNINSNGLIVNSQFYTNETGQGVGGGKGAGIYNDNSSPSVSHCSFHRNRTGDALQAVYFAEIADAGGDGAGMYNGVHSSPIVNNCIFTHNRTGNGGEILPSAGHVIWGSGEGYKGGDGGYGAGMYNGKDSSPTLIDCIFRNNITGNGGKGQDALARSASEWFVSGFDGGDGGDGGKGAGLYNDADSSSVIEACTFLENETGIGGPGGKRGWALFKNGKPGKPGKGGNGAAIANVSASSAVSHSTFAANSAYDGGGVYNDQSTVDLINCLFRQNRATHQGSGVYNINSEVVMTHCTLFSNGSGANSEDYGIHNNNSHPIVTNCILWGNLPGEIHNVNSAPVVTYSNVKDGTGQSWFGTGCINVDPLFLDNHGRLSAYSPCRGVGSLTAPGLPGRDLDGNPRITGTTVDLGAYEFSHFTVFNDTQFTSHDFIQAAIDAANENDRIRVLPGTYLETINFLGKAIRLYSEDGPEVTIIDGSMPIVLLQEDFNDGNYEGWTIVDQGQHHGPSIWVVEGGQLVQKSNIHGTPLTDPKMLGTFALWDTAAAMDWTDYAMTVTMKSTDDDAMGLMFRYQDEHNYYRFAWLNQNHGQGVGRRQLSRMQNGQVTVLAHDDVPYTINQSYQVKIAVSGSFMRVSINGVSALTATDSTFVDGSVALFCWGNQSTFFDNVEVVLPNYHVVQCISGEGPDTILEGFTITGGNANGTTTAERGGGGMRNVGSSPTVVGCIFTANSASYSGGGMYNEYSNPSVIDCTFIGNSSLDSGGGIGNYSSNPTITHCVFTGNSAGQHGGGMYSFYGNPTVKNCIFNDNWAPFGGGMSSTNSRPTVINGIFKGNHASHSGGGMNNGGGGSVHGDSPTVINCTFRGNSASVSGGAMSNVLGGKPTVTNSILWGNTAPTAPEIHIASDSSPTFTYCAVQGESVWPGTGNINADPRFIDAAAGNLRLDDNSPCIDAGNNAAVPEDLAVDLDGDLRLRDGNLNSNAVVDMGAYEYYGRVRNTTANSVYRNIQNAITDSQNGDRIVAAPGVYLEKIDFTGKNISLSSIDPDDPSIVAQTILHGQYSGGSVVTFGWSQGGGWDCLLDGFTITGGSAHVGAAIYSYNSGPTIRNCVIRDNRSATSIIKAVWGSPSFIGCTVINNVVWGYSMWDEPVGTVLFFECYDILLEDCTIHNNRAVGGGIRFWGPDNWNTTLTIVDSSITENLNSYVGSIDFHNHNGGGIYFNGGQLFIEDCYIAENKARHPDSCGGGIWIEGASSLGISRSSIINNQAGIDGGGLGIFDIYGPGTIDRCDISGNDCGRFGGGLYRFSGEITNSAIFDNSAGHSGGGLYEFYGSMTNCTVSNNVSGAAGGGLAVGGWNGSWANITNCVFTNNSAVNGGGLSDFAGSMSNCLILGNRATSNGGGLYQCTGNLTNTIIRQNFAAGSGDQLYDNSIPTYSNIEGWAGGGVGNTALDPLFRQAGYWVDGTDPNLVVEADHPNAVWAEGNYRLSPGSPCIDAGDNAAVPEVVTTDLNGWSRFIDDLCTTDTGSGTGPIVDMGAYEFLPADMDGSGRVTLSDYSILAAHWQQSGGECAGADMNCDGVVDLTDMILLAEWWLM